MKKHRRPIHRVKHFIRLYSEYPISYDDFETSTRTLTNTDRPSPWTHYQHYDVTCVEGEIIKTGQPRNFSKLKQI